MQAEEIVEKLKEQSVPEDREGMKRFGIDTSKALGIRIPILRKMAKEIGKNHQLAQELWDTDLHEIRILASMIDDPKLVTEEQMDQWVKGFNSWDICDQCCMNLFDKTEFAKAKALEWSSKEEEFVRRAGFALMASLALHRNKHNDEYFMEFFPMIKEKSTDERNFVKKAVNWALRQIGKRNLVLNEAAIKTAEEIQNMDSKSAKWIAMDALRELKSEAIQKRLS
ncbi:MAG: DNA alkylation repair protein [Candidatus Aenigmarchaeota archaeon]|nr:DNA alkylation repair protein [Candidatus Aenigmarchaeota archaeon]